MMLGAVSWRMAKQDPVLLVCLIGGVILSITGMILRWTAYQIDD